MIGWVRSLRASCSGLCNMLRTGGCAVAVSLVGVAAPAGPLGLGTMAPGTLSHSTGMAIAGVMTERGGPEIRVLPNAGEAVLLELLAEGELDFAVANAMETYRAAAGTGEDRLAVAALLYPLQVGLFVRKDSDIASVADLAGRRVTAGYAASPAIAQLLAALLAAGGLSGESIEPVNVSDLVTGADRFSDGRADAFFFALGAAKLAEIAATVPIRLLPLPGGADAQARARAVAPVVYITTVAPRPNLAGVMDPTPVLTFDNLLVTRTDTSAEAVDAILGTLIESRQALIDRLPVFAGFDASGFDDPRPGVPFHPAALARAARP